MKVSRVLLRCTNIQRCALVCRVLARSLNEDTIAVSLQWDYAAQWRCARQCSIVQRSAEHDDVPATLLSIAHTASSAEFQRSCEQALPGLSLASYQHRQRQLAQHRFGVCAAVADGILHDLFETTTVTVRAASVRRSASILHNACRVVPLSALAFCKVRRCAA